MEFMNWLTSLTLSEVIQGIKIMGAIIITTVIIVVYIIMLVKSIREFDERVKCPWEKEKKKDKKSKGIKHFGAR